MIHDGSAIQIGYSAVRRTSLRAHPGVLEIVLVLRGALDVTVSCERFALREGDYAVLNAGDPHLLVGSADNATAILQLRLEEFADHVPGLGGVIFACESFDLPRFRRTENSLRRRILDVLLAAPGHDLERAAALLAELADGYAFEDYYERRRSPSRARRLQFRQLVIAMQDRIAERDVLDQIATGLHYRKASLSRIVRETTAVSFSDLLTYLRVSAAERKLVRDDATVAQIAAECGFSDLKYLTRAFRAWFGESPADYRRRTRGLVEADDEAPPCRELGRSLAEALRGAEQAEQRPSRLSITPLLVKNLGGRADLFRTVAELARAPEMPERITTPPRPHLLPVRVPAGGAPPLDWVAVIRGIDRESFRPVLILPVADADLARTVAGEVIAAGEDDVEYWLAYEGGLGAAADGLAERLRAELGVEAVPMRVG
ncbi:AraC family transcriptional regulator [Leucobacter allii]|uniref:AraC family transcriptional regulator n=1 Tax=Leucobacter allii TaxID=2932247 RepID=A0ABY4FJT9_9MICO|nr:helix-turn-helix domain-containing protein [Leucobacter allii]UOQ56324.1 AraC family transcriptional regulator [Leucobacter allii]